MYRGLAIVGTALAAGVLAAAPVASARHGADDSPAHVAADDSTGRAGDNGVSGSGGGGNRDDVRVRGTCSASSSAKLKLSPENGKVEVEYEVDENRNGSAWRVTLKRNGTIVRTRTATTRAPSGSFELRAVIAPGAAKTTVTAIATRAATGEVCRATATL